MLRLTLYIIHERNKKMYFSNIESTEKVILGLMAGANDLSALNGGAFLTTRLPNIILDLRGAGLEIETELHKTHTGKRFGIYRLVDSKVNYQKTHELLEYVQGKLSGR